MNDNDNDNSTTLIIILFLLIVGLPTVCAWLDIGELDLRTINVLCNKNPSYDFCEVESVTYKAKED